MVEKVKAAMLHSEMPRVLALGGQGSAALANAIAVEASHRAGTREGQQHIAPAKAAIEPGNRYHRKEECDFHRYAHGVNSILWRVCSDFLRSSFAFDSGGDL